MYTILLCTTAHPLLSKTFKFLACIGIERSKHTLPAIPLSPKHQLHGKLIKLEAEVALAGHHASHLSHYLTGRHIFYFSFLQYTSTMKSPRQVLCLLVPHVASDTTVLDIFANPIDEDSQKKFMASIWPKITAGWAAALHESLQPRWFRLFVL